MGRGATPPRRRRRQAKNGDDRWGSQQWGWMDPKKGGADLVAGSSDSAAAIWVELGSMVDGD